MTKNCTRQRLLNLAQERGIFRASEAEAAGVHPQYLSRLLAQGILERVARGCYRLAEADTTEHHTLAVVATAVPSAVICLLSALQFHQIGTQTSLDVWIALERGTRKPQLDYPPLQVVYFSGGAFALGVESHIIEGQTVRIYSVAKTIADCFKHRNKLGLDVALEALTDAWRQRRLSLSELNIFARANRVQRILQPYIEVLIQ